MLGKAHSLCSSPEETFFWSAPKGIQIAHASISWPLSFPVVLVDSKSTSSFFFHPFFRWGGLVSLHGANWWRLWRMMWGVTTVLWPRQLQEITLVHQVISLLQNCIDNHFVWASYICIMFVYGLILEQHSSPACTVGDFTHLGLFFREMWFVNCSCMGRVWEEGYFVPGGPHLAVYSHWFTE